MRTYASCFLLGLLVSCGARTGLPVPDQEGGQSAGGGTEGGGGATAGGGEGGEGGLTGGGGEGGAPPPECEDPETTQYIYLVTQESALFSYYPLNGSVKSIGTLDCPADGATPFSMGVNRVGEALVLYTDGNLYRVSTLDASCEPTDFAAGQEGFLTFGMGFALDEAGGTEDTLYVAEITFNEPSDGLARIDTESFELDTIGEFTPAPLSDRIEMTGSSDGNLWGFFLDQNGLGGWVVRLDKDTAEILEATQITAGSGPSALAFSWWGGDFYVFTANGGEPTVVTRFDPDTGEVGVVTTLSGTVVGAGVSTCAPLSL